MPIGKGLNRSFIDETPLTKSHEAKAFSDKFILSSNELLEVLLFQRSLDFRTCFFSLCQNEVIPANEREFSNRVARSGRYRALFKRHEIWLDVKMFTGADAIAS